MNDIKEECLAQTGKPVLIPLNRVICIEFVLSNIYRWYDYASVLIPLNRVICIEYGEVFQKFINDRVLIPLNRVICIEFQY